MKKILYLIDDINYKSGAQKVTLFQMQQLQREYDIYMLSLTRPKASIDFLDESHVLGDDVWPKTELYAESFQNVMRSERYSLKEKIQRICYAFALRIGKGERYFNYLIEESLRPLMEKFDDIVVVSEASKLRSLVAELKSPKKIQWIHTDYARWCEFSEWTKAVTRYDKKLYFKFDVIVVLSEYCKQGLIERLPEVLDKVAVVPNMIDGDKILAQAALSCPIKVDSDCLNLVTVARLDKEKRITKLLHLAKELKGKINFKWYVIGDGPDRSMLERLRNEYKLEDCVIFLGHLDNPYPIMKECAALVLLSKYEGTPVTIDEAMVLGIGIIAPKIGGIPEQIKDYDNGYLITDDQYLKVILMMKLEKHCLFDYSKKNNEIQELLSGIL